MNFNALPIFTSHYSRKSILTFDTVADAKKNNKTSIFTICKDFNIERPFIVENSMTGFMEMYKNAQKESIFPRFGLRKEFVSDLSETGKENAHKVVVFIANTQGYKDLIKLHNRANLDNEGYFTKDLFNSFFTENLQLIIPFYDSYLHQNILMGKACIPDFGVNFAHFIENNNLPFDTLISNKIEIGVPVQSIFYRQKKEFVTTLAYKCSLNMNNKGKHRTLSNPMFDNYHSDSFAFESFLERFSYE